MRPVSALPSLPSITDTASAVQRHAASFRDTLRWAWSRATRRQHNGYVSQLARNAFGKRVKCIEQTVAIVVDIAQRGTLEDAEAIGNHLVAIARAEHPSTDPQLSLVEAKIAESMAQGECDAAEDRMMSEPSITNLLAYRAAGSRHAEARRVLNRVADLMTVRAS